MSKTEFLECPVCEYPFAEAKYLLGDRFFRTTDELFDLYECASCGLLFQLEEPIKDRLADFYPKGYWWKEDPSQSPLEGRYREWTVRNDQLRFLLEVVPQPQGIRLLDVGCGGGNFLRLATEAGFDAYGLENSVEAARIAEEAVPGRILSESMEELISRGERFEVICMFHTLEHVLDPFRFLKRLHRVLERPGIVILQVPNRASLQASVLGRRWYGLDCPRHLYNFTTFSLLHLLGKADFRVRSIRHFSLRDNAAAIVSSCLPRLDPMSQRVRHLRKKGIPGSLGRTLKNVVYLSLLMGAQPLAFLESNLGRGGTVTVHATLE